MLDAGGLNFSTSLTTFQVRDEVADRERSWQLFDYNQDGREDLLLATFPNGGFSGEWKVYLSNGTSFNSTAVALPQPLTFVGEDSVESELLTDAALADFDGDGLTDLLLPASINGEIRFQIRYLRRATSSFTCPTGSTSNACPYEFSAPQKIDVFAEIEQQKIEAEGEAGRAVQQAIAEAQQMEAGKQRRLSTTPQLDATTPPVQGAPEVQPEQ